jgi:putative endonuclease
MESPAERLAGFLWSMVDTEGGDGLVANGRGTPAEQTKKARGLWGEDLAVKHLRAHGYEVVCRNWRYRRYEIDLVCKHRWTWVFVEVKVRAARNERLGFEWFPENQQQRIVRAAHHFLLQQRGADRNARFDVIFIQHERGSWRLDHWLDAFLPRANR